MLIEDGSGVEDAEAFADVATADAYATARAIVEWTSEDSEVLKEAALRRAADYLRDNYVELWKGKPNEDDQALPFPRDGNDVIPNAIVRANIELAFIALNEPLFETEDARGAILEERRGVGPLQRAIRYAEDGRRQRVFRQVEKMLSPFLKTPGLRVVRA